MKEDEFRVYAEYYDQIYLARKNYGNEAEIIRGVIRKFENGKSETLLDVGCGTGEHLKFLSSDFQCVGLDINKKMIEKARKKVPDARFKVAGMLSFKLKEKFDVIVCLFSSIGYVQNYRNLVKTLGNFRRHLSDGGLVIVEPWVFKKDFRKENIVLSTYEDEKVKLARMATSKIENSRWLIYMHYLLGEDGEISYFREVHRMLALDYSGYVKAFESARFEETKYLTENLWDGCRGLFVAKE